MNKKIITWMGVLILLLVGGMPEAVAAPFVVVSEADGGPIPAYLFLSNTCPWCRKLKQEGFADKFRSKYAEDVTLKEYEVSSAEGQKKYRELSRTMELPSGVPLLVIGTTTISGYSEDILVRAGQAVQKERKSGRYKKTAPAKKEEPAGFISITMEDEELKGVAPAKDLKQMQAYLRKVEEKNEALLTSTTQLFNSEVSRKVMSIAHTYEQKMKRWAAKSPSFESFKQKAVQLEEEQQKEVDGLLRLSIDQIRK